jgi:hypothetical protein
MWEFFCHPKSKPVIIFRMDKKLLFSVTFFITRRYWVSWGLKLSRKYKSKIFHSRGFVSIRTKFRAKENNDKIWREMC